MSKIGIRKIKIIKKGEVHDLFFDASGLSKNNFYNFKEIDFVQDSASLSDKAFDDDNGVYHIADLEFITRKSFEQWNGFVKNFIGLPVVIMVESVDGSSYIIGTNKAPAYITVNNSYQKLDTREIRVTCTYKNRDGLLKIENDSNTSLGDDTLDNLTVNKDYVKIPWQGGCGVISVFTTYKSWSVNNSL